MPRYEPFDWYAAPLYYDIIFDAETPREVEFLTEAHTLHGLSGGKRALEPACGSGRLMSPMAKCGYEVTGLDICPGMLDFARKRFRKQRVTATLVEASMERFDLPGRFDLAWCLVSSFKYLLTDASAQAHLRLMADHLTTGGIYILGLHLSDYLDRRRQRERWVAERSGVHVTCNIQSWPPDRRTRTEQVRARLIVREAEQEKRYESQWLFRTYSLAELQGLLNTEPRLEHVATYNFHHDIDQPIPFDGTWFDNVLVLRKR